LDELIGCYLPLEYPHAPGALPPSYPVVPNTEPQLERLFGSFHGAVRGA